ncbi:MAG: DUF4350 domain-containing protein [Saprospiraceae bacterium]
MDRSGRIFLIVIMTIVILSMIMARFAPKPIDWSPSFNTKDKTPLGLYVLDQEIDSIFDNFVERSTQNVGDYFYDGIFEDSSMNDYTLLYINDYLNWDKNEISSVCQFVSEGNHALISAWNLPDNLKDTLSLNIESSGFYPRMVGYKDSVFIYLNDTLTSHPNIISDKALTGGYITTYDSAQTNILGYLKDEKQKKPNFVEVTFGKGKFYIHLEPAVFTNYYLLNKEDYLYADAILGYIPDHHDILWTLYNQTSQVISDSPLRFIHSQASLRWAWYLLLAGIGIFVLFNIRREQRIIRPIPKLANSTVDFVRTIGNLYHLEGEVRNIMDKKIIYTLERIRSEYHIPTDKIDEKWVNTLHQKSSKNKKDIEKMAFLINKHWDTDYTCSIEDLKRINDAIENFYQ